MSGILCNDALATSCIFQPIEKQAVQDTGKFWHVASKNKFKSQTASFHLINTFRKNFWECCVSSFSVTDTTTKATCITEERGVGVSHRHHGGSKTARAGAEGSHLKPQKEAERANSKCCKVIPGKTPQTVPPTGDQAFRCQRIEGTSHSNHHSYIRCIWPSHTQNHSYMLTNQPTLKSISERAHSRWLPPAQWNPGVPCTVRQATRPLRVSYRLGVSRGHSCSFSCGSERSIGQCRVHFSSHSIKVYMQRCSGDRSGGWHCAALLLSRMEVQRHAPPESYGAPLAPAHRLLNLTKAFLPQGFYTAVTPVWHHLGFMNKYTYALGKHWCERNQYLTWPELYGYLRVQCSQWARPGLPHQQSIRTCSMQQAAFHCPQTLPFRFSLNVAGVSKRKDEKETKGWRREEWWNLADSILWASEK